MVKLNFWKNDIIEFYTTPDLFGAIPEPRPAIKFMPDWFKRIPTKLDDRKDERGNPTLTAKKCMPLLDVMSTGFIIPLACDTRLEVSADGASVKPTNSPLTETISFHDVRQLGEHTAPGFPTPTVKWLNKWVIKTAPGWSTLIVSPINHFNPHFTCMGGLVDTDKYIKEINFPAIWHTKGFAGSILAGTPLVQVIPIKRSDLPKKAKPRVINKKEEKERDRIHRSQLSRLGYYTNELRDK